MKPLVRGGLVAGVVLATVAWAAPTDPRGWTAGTVAANAARVLGPLFDEPAEVNLPQAVRDVLDRDTLLVYFSPTCPHCTHVTPELVALHKRLKKRGAKVVGIASSSSGAGALEAWRSRYKVPFEVLVDADGAVASAMGIRSTPSAALVLAQGERRILGDLWYPYQPGYDLLVEMRLSPGKPFSAFAKNEVQGDNACMVCHTTEGDSWALTHHSRAWATLVEDDKQDDPACVGCHVTGQGQTGGWTPGNRDLVNVQCEACHSPGGPHDGARVDATTTCAGCHDAKHRFGFTVDKALPLIDHHLAGHLADADWRERRTQLMAGQVEQRLFAFESGGFVGAAACAECHPEATAHWSSSPHAGAMARLDAAHATEAACVACHATPTVTGPRPTEVSGYRTAESVGCESCHGPGQAHVSAKGGTDNIVGLGDSCSVCVIEAVCTSCHTPEQDPTWSLDEKLPKVGHGRAAH